MSTRRPSPFPSLSFRRPTSWPATPCDTGRPDHNPDLFTKVSLGGAFHYCSLSVLLLPEKIGAKGGVSDNAFSTRDKLIK